VAAAKRELGQAQQDKQDRDIELRELLDSRSSKDAVAAAGRVEGLRREVAALTRQHDDAKVRLHREQEAVDTASTKAAAARRTASDAERRVAMASSAQPGFVM
jgi:chromosome segregation ATPase